MSSMNSPPPPTPDKVGDELNAQRFQMIKDIADELAGEVVFPTCFDAAFRLRQALQDPDLPISRISSIVTGEPLVAAKLMQLANSALYRADGAPAMDVKAAINRLGVDLVRTTAMAIAMRQLIRSKDMLVFKEMTLALWGHSLKTAAAARMLARAHTRINHEEALLAGLIHDLGAFYMLYRAVQYSELIARPDSLKYLILEWHESIGVSLLNTLGMPEEIVATTIDHDQPRAVPDQPRTLKEIVFVGNILAGSDLGWLGEAFDPDAGEMGSVRQQFADFLPHIDADAKEMHAIFA